MGAARTVFMAAAAAAFAGLLAACTSSAEKQQTARLCPPAYKVQDASSLVRFRDGRGRDATDVQFQAEIGRIGVECTFSRDRLEAEVKFELGIAEGPALEGRQSRLEYFVALVDRNEQVVQREKFGGNFRFDGNRNRILLLEEVLIRRIAAADPADVAGYRIIVGFVLTPEEKAYNERAAGRGAPAAPPPRR